MANRPPPGTESLAQGNETIEISYVCTASRVDYSFETTSRNPKCSLSWDAIFAAMSPHLMDDADEDTMKGALSDLVRRTDVRNVEAELGTSWENLTFRVEGNDFQTVKNPTQGAWVDHSEPEA